MGASGHCVEVSGYRVINVSGYQAGVSGWGIRVPEYRGGVSGHGGGAPAYRGIGVGYQGIGVRCWCIGVGYRGIHAASISTPLWRWDVVYLGGRNPGNSILMQWMMCEIHKRILSG